MPFPARRGEGADEDAREHTRRYSTERPQEATHASQMMGAAGPAAFFITLLENAATRWGARPPGSAGTAAGTAVG